jgi:hypothetical protein
MKLQIWQVDSLIGTVELKNGSLTLESKTPLSTGVTIQGLIDSMRRSSEQSDSDLFNELPDRLRGWTYTADVS